MVDPNIVNEIKSELSVLNYSGYLRSLKKLEDSVAKDRLKPIKIAVLRSYTVEMVEPVIKLRLMLDGYYPEFFFGDYNGYVQEILDSSSRLYRFGPDIILLLVRIEELLPSFSDGFTGSDFSDWEGAIKESVEQLEMLVGKLEASLPAQVIVQNIAHFVNPYWGIYDSQIPNGQNYLVDVFNRMLSESLGSRRHVFIWDFSLFVRRCGHSALDDAKMWYTSKNPYKLSAYTLIGADLHKYILSAVGKVKKCIVVDLDNTLWGGIAGEDGMEGVALGHDYPGNCYRDFQKSLLKYYHRGIILAVNSKNNEDDATEIIEKHPYMILRKKHFAASRVNWTDKANNLKELADELNIGLDSMVFVDDNPVECELVRSLCPEVDVLCLPAKPYLIPDALNSVIGLENIKLTVEDRKKGEMYRAQVKRKQYENKFDNLNEFLKSLDMQLDIEPANDFSLPRIAQLTQKTNQMNLTTRRYTEANIKSFTESTNRFVFSVASKDRFGDNGIVGLFILKAAGEECIIDSFLMSCRVIGRGIENAMIAFIADFAKEKGLKTVVGEYLPTVKNKPAADMYDKFNFIKVSDTLFKAELEKLEIDYPVYIKINHKVAS